MIFFVGLTATLTRTDIAITGRYYPNRFLVRYNSKNPIEITTIDIIVDFMAILCSILQYSSLTFLVVFINM